MERAKVNPDPVWKRCFRCGQRKTQDEFVSDLCEVCDEEVRLGGDLYPADWKQLT